VSESPEELIVDRDEVLRLITEAGVPGLAAASIRGGRIDRYLCCGVRRAHSRALVDETTVFEAASLTKPVFAHAALQLVDQGLLSLDVPLGDILPDYVPGDARASTITPRQVLSHSAGLPNWRNAEWPLKTHFPPGDRFSYSGEGYLYLQKAVEAITAKPAHILVEELVLAPFAMTQSSLIWDFRFDLNRAYPHDDFGRAALSFKPGEANAAWSLQTTAQDFARFLLAVLGGARLKSETAALWLRPHIEVRHKRPQCLGPDDDDLATGVAWGLGWGLEPAKGIFFHWGDINGSRAFTIGSIADRCALVIFTNSAMGFSIMPDLLAQFWPGDRPSLAWLNYPRHDAPGPRLLRAARAQGIAAVWPEIEKQPFDADDLRWIARGLDAAGRDADHLWLLARINERGSAARGEEDGKG
jgi:CubicO group peptidase (beta-lactamase class C family)